MAARPPTSRASRFRAALIAIAIGVLTTAVFMVALSIVEQEPLRLGPGWPVLLLPIVLVAIPFLLLAFLGVTSRMTWFVGLGLTAALWGYVVYDTYSRQGDGSGANIGLGWLIMASPILISAACLAAGRRELR